MSRKSRILFISIAAVAALMPQFCFAFGAARQVFYGVEENVDRTVYIHPRDPQIVQLAREITAGSTTNMERVQAIHDWVASNIAYDDDAILPFNITTPASMNDLEVLRNRKGICQGYSDLTAALLQAAGIEAKVVAGQAVSGSQTGEHAWNKAHVDGRWVILDTTWDAGAPPSQVYFDPDPAVFAEDHSEDVEAFL